MKERNDVRHHEAVRDDKMGDHLMVKCAGDSNYSPQV